MFVDDETELWLLARGYFHEDYTLRSANQDEAVLRYVRLEGDDSAQQLAREVRELLDRPASESELAALWTGRYHAAFNPTRNGMTYRAWFERILQLLTEEPATSPEV